MSRTPFLSAAVILTCTAVIHAQTNKPSDGRDVVRVLREEYGVEAGRNKDGEVYVAIFNAADPPRDVTEDDVNRIVDRISRVTTLQWLSLHYIELDKKSLEKLGDLPKLAKLSLSNCRFRDDALEGLRGLPITELDLTGTPISDDGLAHLASLNKLRRLKIPNTKVTGTGFKHLESLPLQELSLNSISITDESLESIGKVHSLQNLDLSHTPISDDGLSLLSGLYLLRTLNVDEAQTTHGGRRWFLEDHAESRMDAEKRGLVPKHYPKLVVIDN